MSKLRDTINEWINERHPEADVLLADGLEEAFIGIAYQCGEPVALFDRAKCISILSRDMSREEAEEYFEFNVQSAYMGPGTPAFLDRFNRHATREEALAQYFNLKKNNNN